LLFVRRGKLLWHFTAHKPRIRIASMSLVDPTMSSPASATHETTLPLEGAGDITAEFGPIWIIEEAAGHLRSQGQKGPASQLRLYRLFEDVLAPAGDRTLTAGVDRAGAVMSMLRQAGATDGVVICSHRAATVPELAELLELHGSLHYVLEVNPTRKIEFVRARKGVRSATPKERLEGANWSSVRLSQPAGSSDCFVSNLGKAALGQVGDLTCFALSIGGIDGYQRGVLIGMTSMTVEAKLKKLAQLLAWTRWIRLAVRRAARNSRSHAAPQGQQVDKETSGKRTTTILVRANRRLASSHDLQHAQQRAQLPEVPIRLKKQLTSGKTTLNVVELFAGAGGMGLGFLNAKSSDGRGYRIAGSAAPVT
jgi:hypothetical protein